MARGAFVNLLETGEMRFIVAAEDLGFNRLPRQIKAAPATQANRVDGTQYLLNLFDRTDENELNALENRVATFLEQQERLFFWYRNRARQDYYVQGWKRGRIYADFIFTLKPDDPDTTDPFHRVFVVETKVLGHTTPSAARRSIAGAATGRASQPVVRARCCSERGTRCWGGRAWLCQHPADRPLQPSLSRFS